VIPHAEIASRTFGAPALLLVAVGGLALVGVAVVLAGATPTLLTSSSRALCAAIAAPRLTGAVVQERLSTASTRTKTEN
jgi:hypothetical protein